MSNLLPKGSVAPDFTGIDQNGRSIRLSELRGKKVIIYFYPKDDTPGCTKEACNLRDNYEKLQAAGYVVLGISADDVESHKHFAEKYHLPFPLIADTEKTIIKAYGAWGVKKMYGKAYEGIQRITYIIDEDGRISDVITKVKTDAHAEQILGSS
ncbi:MAG: thioredoxin-dependent thiol peroxidase [Bacteroidia bacterium]|nr:thioredoxin-dependent thiol peroxidase [Bacteroidia bacterium]MCX7651341.1 thioredoxin-dependent thiol peroxidase [Bacteroidia bacterium]MDW8417139.1 thioredoxin-dependent thiol peroxidase [Bacteroidia bacterium]